MPFLYPFYFAINTKKHHNFETCRPELNFGQLEMDVVEHLVFINKTKMSSELKRAKGQQGARDVNNDRSNLSSIIQLDISVSIEHKAHLEAMQPEMIDLSDSDNDLDSLSPIFDEVYNTTGNEGLVNSLKFSAL